MPGRLLFRCEVFAREERGGFGDLVAGGQGAPLRGRKFVRCAGQVELREDFRRGVGEKRPVLGLECPRSEVSGRRLWGLFARRFGAAENFFAEHFVVNYCPLAFMAASGANLTPDKLPAAEIAPLFAACDAHLRAVAEALQPDWLIGVGDFAEKRLRQVFDESGVRIGKILHPSPASPAANRDWAGAATKQLLAHGVWRNR